MVEALVGNRGLEVTANHAESESSKDIIARSNRWANERFSWHKFRESFFQWRARKSVVHAIEKDMGSEYQLNGKQMHKLTQKFLKIQAEKGNAKILTTTVHDILTGKQYHVVLRQGSDGSLIAEERRKPFSADTENDQTVIVSQSILHPSGKGSLTLNFTEKQYVLNDANPHIINKAYTRGAKKVFDLLFGVVKKNTQKV